MMIIITIITVSADTAITRGDSVFFWRHSGDVLHQLL